ncbi:MAG TPA: hypothetical protein VLS48_05430, partial [Anaerolineales bacterium]|nr:hypothetical protein [Anaerolineales bacterium]
MADSMYRIGAYRPIYLWAGPGTVRMNRLKFMNQPVDEAAHAEAHTKAGAGRVLEGMDCNWVHLMYDWGFPPEIEQEDWEDFERAAQVYHSEGGKVFGYIQTSNCVYTGSYRQKDWYARDPNGGKIFYYSGRYMACLIHPEWIEHLKEMARGALARGADGIFFDNLWFGAMPISEFGAWLGPAGCFCDRCRQAYWDAHQEPIPQAVHKDDASVRRYLRWRADQVTNLVRTLREHIHTVRPSAPISANDYDIYMRSAYVVYGIDLAQLAEVQEITMIENFALPAWQALPRPRLANNALTIRNARSVVQGKAHLSTLSYDVGIGFDGLYAPRRYQQGLAEAAACGASHTIKGTEYFVDGQHTVLTPPAFAPIHQAVGQFNRWLETNQDLFAGLENDASIGLLFPGEDLWLDWQTLAPLYLGVGQSLLYEGIPWRVVHPGDSLDGLQTLIVFSAESLAQTAPPPGLTVILAASLAGWGVHGRPLAERARTINAAVSTATHGLMNLYFSSKPAHRLMDKLGLPKLITQTSLFYVPAEKKRRSLLAALPGALFPRLHAAQPALLETWRRPGERQFHLVNYADTPQTVRLQLGAPVEAVV